MFTPHVRKYIYAILIAIGPIVTFYGLASHEEVALWLGVGATVLAVPGNSLALKNINREDEDFATVDIEVPSVGKHAAF